MSRGTWSEGERSRKGFWGRVMLRVEGVLGEGCERTGRQREREGQIEGDVGYRL
jgi:hypothetical protein